MKIILPNHVTIGVFELPLDREKTIPKEATLFIGGGTDFNFWKYAGSKQKVLIRIRRPGLIPLEFTGTISKRALTLTTVNQNDPGYTPTDAKYRKGLEPSNVDADGIVM